MTKEEERIENLIEGEGKAWLDKIMEEELGEPVFHKTPEDYDELPF